MNLTAHPFVDAGLGIIAALRNKDSVAEVTCEDSCSVVADMLSQMESLQRIKVLSTFWQNNPFTGINPSSLPEYQAFLRRLSQPEDLHKGWCQICGNAGALAPVNRSWMPLAGGVNDASTLPNLSGKWLCADCFRAIVVLPLGCKFCSAGPYFIQVADPQWQANMMREPVDAVRTLRLARATSNKELKTDIAVRGRVELLEITSGTEWDITQKGADMPQSGATIIAFNNGGTSAGFMQLHLPAQALEFLTALKTAGDLRHVFLGWAKVCSGAEYTDTKTKEKRLNPFHDQICDDIELRRSVAPLVAAITRRQAKDKDAELIPLMAKEKKVLEIYEDKLLGKKERFVVLEQIASRIRSMDEGPQRSFLRQLGNIRSKRVLLDMLKQLSHDQHKNGFERLSLRELRVLDESNDEAVSLLYLLCVAEEEKEEDK